MSRLFRLLEALTQDELFAMPWANRAAYREFGICANRDAYYLRLTRGEPGRDFRESTVLIEHEDAKPFESDVSGLSSVARGAVTRALAGLGIHPPAASGVATPLTAEQSAALQLMRSALRSMMTGREVHVALAALGASDRAIAEFMTGRP